MNITEQMDTGLDDLLREIGAYPDEETRRVLRLAWLDGYKRGMNAVHGIAEAAFAQMKEELA